MTVKKEEHNGLCKLQIEGEMTIFTAAELKKNLLDNLTACSELEIDLSQVSEMDTAGLQLLLLVKMESFIANKEVHITMYSPATLSVLQSYNLNMEEF